jgi:hypothetical protein
MSRQDTLYKFARNFLFCSQVWHETNIARYIEYRLNSIELSSQTENLSRYRRIIESDINLQY